MASSTQWRVDIALPAGSDVAALKRFAASHGSPGEQISVRDSEDSDSGIEAVFSVEMLAFGEEDAMEGAAGIFDFALKSSDAGPGPDAWLIGIVPPAARSAEGCLRRPRLSIE